MANQLNKIFSGAKVLITGHTGFKGAWLTLWLGQLGAKVCGISLNVPTQPSHYKVAEIDSLVETQWLDIREGESIGNAICEFQPDFVFHLAAQALVKQAYVDPVTTYETNMMGTVNVLEGLRRLKKSCVAVLITSDKCYDNVEWVWGYRETDALGGPDPYSASKGAAELAIRSYVKSFFHQGGHIRIGVARAGNVIGGGDWAEDRIVPDCVQAWAKGEIVPLRNPQATRPWQHVLEPLSGYINLAMALYNNDGLHGQSFNFGPVAQQNYSVGDLVVEMTKYWDQVRWKDLSEKYGGPYESRMLKLNCDKALHHLHWHAVWNFEETVRATAIWYRHYYQASHDSIVAFSRQQITDYIAKARTKGLPWAL